MDAFVQLNMPYHSENAFVCHEGRGLEDFFVNKCLMLHNIARMQMVQFQHLLHAEYTVSRHAGKTLQYHETRAESLKEGDNDGNHR